jgi:hypothetical protein
LLAIVGLGVLTYRVATNAWAVRQLEQRHCIVNYWQEPDVEDALPRFLREWFGEHWWSDVRDVSKVDWSRNRDNVSEDDLSAICKACRTFRRLRSFNISSNRFTCAQMRDWPSLSGLEELSVRSTKLSDADMTVISRMSRLKSLKLSDARVTSDGLAQLASLPRLETLGLYPLEFIARSSSTANGFQALKRLEIDNSPKADDEAMVAFGPLPALEELVLNLVPVGDRGLEQLLSGGKVYLLILNQSWITDSGLKLVAKCPSPISLHIAGTQVTDDGLRSIAGMKFRSLVLDNTLITDDGLLAIGPLDGLWALSLGRSKVTGGGLACADNTKIFPKVWLEGAAVTRQGLGVLANLNVGELSVAETTVTDDDLMLFADNDATACVNVKGTQVTREGVRALYEARKQRLAALSRAERLIVVSDYPGIVEQYLPESEAERIADHF